MWAPEPSPGWTVPAPSASHHMSGAPISFVALMTSPLTRLQTKFCCHVPAMALQYISQVNYLWICLWLDPVQLVLGSSLPCLFSFPAVMQTVPLSAQWASPVQCTHWAGASHFPQCKYSWIQYEQIYQGKAYRPCSEMALKSQCCLLKHNATFQQRKPGELSWQKQKGLVVLYLLQPTQEQQIKDTAK